MGSLFKTSVPRYSPVSYVPQTYTATGAGSSSTATSSSSSTSSSPSSSSSGGTGTVSTVSGGTTEKASDEDTVREFIRNNVRGRNSLIQTSYRGVLTDLNSLVPQRKSLLGE